MFTLKSIRLMSNYPEGKALPNHPLVGDLDVAEPLVDEMLKAHCLDFA